MAGGGVGLHKIVRGLRIPGFCTSQSTLPSRVWHRHLLRSRWDSLQHMAVSMNWGSSLWVSL